MLKTALLPALTVGVKNSADTLGIAGLKDVPTAVSGIVTNVRNWQHLQAHSVGQPEG